MSDEPTTDDEPGPEASTDDLLRYVGAGMHRLTDAVLGERVGRDMTTRLARRVIVLAFAILVAVLTGAGVTGYLVVRSQGHKIDKLERTAITCQSRQQSREDARDGLVRISDALAKDNPNYPTVADRAKAHALAQRIAMDAYPPLSCTADTTPGTTTTHPSAPALTTCAGRGPFVRGRDAEYDPALDADHDGVACE